MGTFLGLAGVPVPGGFGMLGAVTLLQVASALLVGGATLTAEGERCPADCSCASSPCPPGVSWVSDGCGCCKICARQFNEDCSATRPCDHIKGLRCHLGAGGDPDRGLCRAEPHGLPCAFDGRVYQHGEDFQPACQHLCTCMNGVVGCVPLCPPQVALPRPWRCSRPRLARPDDACCERWLCDHEDDDDDNRVGEEPDDPPPPGHAHPHPNHIDAMLRIEELRRHAVANGGIALEETASFPVSEVVLQPPCFPQSSEWSSCSAACGTGLSTRETNHNPACQLVRETRLCQIRHCDLPPLPPAGGKVRRCQRTVRPLEPVSISFGSCSTAPRYRPRSCGVCVDGRCCSPSAARTVRLRFRCPAGDTFYNVMWIQRCSCEAPCSRDAFSPSVHLHNDIHTFRD